MTEERPSYTRNQTAGDVATIANCSFKFQCDQVWESMTPTSNDGIKHCSQCNKDVFQCTSLEEVVNHARLGHCVAIVMSSMDQLVGSVVIRD